MIFIIIIIIIIIIIMHSSVLSDNEGGKEGRDNVSWKIERSFHNSW